MKKTPLTTLTIILLLIANTHLFAADEGFEVSIRIKAPVTITERSALYFGEFESTGSTQNITVSPDDSGAASFDIAGDAFSASWSILESFIDLVNGSKKIRVDDFTVSGGGTGVLPITSVKVGATARIKPNQSPGVYTGTATFSVVYN